MIHLDTSVVVAALSGGNAAAARLRDALEDGERVLLSTIVLYEWLRGARHRAELDAQEGLFPQETAVVFGAHEAARAAQLYTIVPRAVARQMQSIDPDSVRFLNPQASPDSFRDRGGRRPFRR